MKKYLLEYRPFLIFLGSFFFAYIALTLLYQWYLSQYDSIQSDGLTALVSFQTEWVLRLFGCDVAVYPVLNEWYVNYKGVTIVRIVEGCNAVSVILLFVSFIVAFAGTLKKTLLFIVFGIVSICFLNVMRIAALIILLYNFPQYTHFLHGVLFPLIIYGTVFILWFFWITKYSKYAN